MYPAYGYAGTCVSLTLRFGNPMAGDTEHSVYIKVKQCMSVLGIYISKKFHLLKIGLITVVKTERLCDTRTDKYGTFRRTKTCRVCLVRFSTLNMNE